MLMDAWQRMAQSIINTSHLVITSQKQARDACKIHCGTKLTNIMINNRWQSASQPAEREPRRAKHSALDPRKNLTGDPKLGDTFVTAAVPASYFRSKSKQRRLPAFNDKRNHNQPPKPPSPKKKIRCKKESLHIPFNKGVANLSEWLSNSPLLGVWRRGGGWWRGLEKPRCPPSAPSISINAPGCLT